MGRIIAAEGTFQSFIPAHKFSSTDELTIEFSIFPDLHGKEILHQKKAWGDLCKKLADPPEYANKTSCPLIKLATFGDTRTPTGSLRTNKNMTALSGVEADYDAGVVSMQDAADMLAKAGIEAVLHSTASSTPQAPRWRVLCPLSRPYAPADRTRFAEVLNAALGGIIASESFTLSQAFYIGRVQGLAYESVRTRGHPIDAVTSKANSANSAPLSKVALFGGPLPVHLQGVEPGAMTTALAGTYAFDESPANISKLKSALVCIDPDLSYPEFFKVIKGLWHLAHSCGWQSAQEIARSWASGTLSATPSVKFFLDGQGTRLESSQAQEQFNRRWDALTHANSGADITAATIFHIAQASGWTLATNANDAQEWQQPDPLPNNLLPVQSFDFNLLPVTLQPWANDIVDRTQCPADFVGVTIMSALGTVIGRRIGIRPKQQDDWTEFCNTWACVVGRPGVMKSPAMLAALAPLNALAAIASKQYKDEKATYDADAQVFAMRADAHKKNIAKTLGKDASAPIPTSSLIEPVAPALKRYLVNDASVEALLDICIENPHGVCAYRDELVSMLKTLEREGQESARGFYLSGWNGNSSYTADRIGRGRNMHAEAVCLSLLGSTQPGHISNYLRTATNGGSGDDGLIQRFSLLVWPDVTGTWVNVDRWPDGPAKKAAFILFETLDAADPVTDWGGEIVTGHDDQPVDGVPPYLRFDDHAAKTFLAWRTDLEHELRADTLPPALESHLAKYRKLVPSMALICHLADGGKGPVTNTALLRALAWADYLRSHAERAYSAVTRADIAGARALLKRIRKGDVVDGFTARDVYRNQWAMLSSPEEVSKALAVLLDYGWLRSTEQKTGGRAKTMYHINPLAQ